MIDLSRFQNKMSDRCFRVLTRAVDESQRRQHFFLGIEHLFLALLEIEHDLFKEMAEDVRPPLDLVDEAVQAQMHTAKQYLGVGMRIPSDTKLVFKHAWEEAQKRGRNLIQSADLLAAMFRDDQSLPARTLMSFGVSPDENRIDEVVVFTPLSEVEVRQIVGRHLAPLDAHLRGFGKSLSYTEEAAAALALKGYSIQYGARFLKRVIDETVKLPVVEQWDRSSRFILDLRAGVLLVHSAN